MTRTNQEIELIFFVVHVKMKASISIVRVFRHRREGFGVPHHHSVVVGVAGDDERIVCCNCYPMDVGQLARTACTSVLSRGQHLPSANHTVRACFHPFPRDQSFSARAADNRPHWTVCLRITRDWMFMVVAKLGPMMANNISNSSYKTSLSGISPLCINVFHQNSSRLTYLLY